MEINGVRRNRNWNPENYSVDIEHEFSKCGIHVKNYNKWAKKIIKKLNLVEAVHYLEITWGDDKPEISLSRHGEYEFHKYLTEKYAAKKAGVKFTPKPLKVIGLKEVKKAKYSKEEKLHSLEEIRNRLRNKS